VSAEEKFPMMDTIMQALDGDQLTVLFVEHDMDIVERYATAWWRSTAAASLPMRHRATR
jgi:ABC-type branched-subunit amino acid transport system ATPase component